MRPELLRTFLCLLMMAAALPSIAADNLERKGWEGTAGIGPIFVPTYTGGKSRRVVAAPLVDAGYEDFLRIDLFRTTGYVAASEDRKLGLGIAAEPRFGFKAPDGSRLAGMAARKDTLEGGLSLDWEAPWVDVNVSWFGDLTGSARGTSFNATLEKELLERERWSLSALAGFDRLGARTANYYFGVRTNEASPGRAFYQPGTTTNLLAGMKGQFHLDRDNAVMFGTYITRLGAAAAASPIVETREARIFWLGYAWNL